jgi:hypothetical protein
MGSGSGSDEQLQGLPDMDLLAMLSTPSRLILRSLSSAHPELVEDLKAFDLEQTVSRAAGLMTCIEFHPNTIRLEVLNHLALAYARGERTPRKKDLDRWLNRWLGATYVARFEDPVEDAFITNIMGPDGNYRLFDGVWEANDYYLQDVVDVLDKAPKTYEELQGLWRRSRALMLVSELIVSRSGATRYSLSEGRAKGPMRLPSDNELAKLARRVLLSRDDLARLPFDAGILGPFVHSRAAAGETYADEGVGNSSFEASPLLSFDRGFVLALPTAVSVAIRRHVVAECRRVNQISQFKSLLKVRQLTRVTGEALLHLNPFPRDVSPPRSALHPEFVDHFVVPFDVDKNALFVVVHANPEQVLVEGFPAPYALEPGDQQKLDDFLVSRVNQLAQMPGCAGGLVVIALGGIGQAWALTMPHISERWHYVSFNMADLMTLAWSEVAPLTRLYKLKVQEKELVELGVTLRYPNGELNLFSMWRDQRYRLVPDELPVRSGSAGLFAATDFVTGLRKHVRQGHDTHAVFRPRSRSWVPVKRLSLEYFFDRSALSVAYVSFSHASSGNLLGVIEAGRRAWWISVTPSRLKSNEDFAYRIWEGMLSWLARAKKVLLRLDRTLPIGMVEILVEVSALNEMPTELADLPSTFEAPTVQVDPGTLSITVHLPLAFFKSFHDFENVAERHLVTSLFEGVGLLSTPPFDRTQAEALAAQVLGGRDARFIHAPFARTWRELATGLPLPAMRLVQEEDLGRASMDIGLLSDIKAEVTSIEGSNDCNKFLNDAVQSIWKRLQSRLVQLDRRSLITTCLRNHEAVARDRNQWRLSSRALLALYGEDQDVYAVAGERESRRNMATLSMRVVAEMGLPTCPESGGRNCSLVDLDSLAAETALLIETAYDSDAIHAGWSAARTNITPSGRVNTDRSFFANVVAPYTRGHFGAMFDAAAEHYSRRYQIAETVEASDEGDFGNLNELFEAEFGMPFGLFADAVKAIGRHALDTEQVLIRTSMPELRQFLVAQGVLSSEQADRFMHRFTLRPRKRWDERAPEGAEAKDWYPWRFRRKLSLMNRPMVALSRSEDTDMLVAPGLLEDCARRLLHGISGAEYPASFFDSQEARVLIGRRANLLGETFEDDVAKILRQAGWEAKVRVPMTQLIAPAELGDVDVIAWRKEGRRVLCIECKRLLAALTIGEITEQLDRFRGEAGDLLDKHMKRLNWLRANLGQVLRFTGKGAKGVELISLLVTNAKVPISYINNLPIPKRNVVPAEQLAVAIKAYQ